MGEFQHLSHQIIENAIPPESLRLIHPLARDLILKVLCIVLFFYILTISVVFREESTSSLELRKDKEARIFQPSVCLVTI